MVKVGDDQCTVGAYSNVASIGSFEISDDNLRFMLQSDEFDDGMMEPERMYLHLIYLFIRHMPFVSSLAINKYPQDNRASF